jgi:two-component system, cell cycle sensor histidine kinase and response regulator CckA
VEVDTGEDFIPGRFGGESQGGAVPVKKAIATKEQRFRLLFAEHPQPMLIFEPSDGTILEANQAAGVLYGCGQAELVGSNISALMGSENAQQLIRDLAAGVEPETTAERHKSKTGVVIEIEMAVHRIDYGGKTACLAVLMDVTTRKALEDQLRQAQKMEAVGMLAGGVAHDFNNLLTIISGYSQLMLNTLPPKDPNRHAVEQIFKAGDRAAALTRQLLAFSRRQMIQPKVLDLNQLVTSLGGMLRRLIGEDVDLRLSLQPDLGRVSSDSGQLEQVLMNLAVNARDAMPKGGTLTIETANLELDEGYSSRDLALKAGSYVLLAVCDTGSGMTEETKDRLFEPFFTTKAPGRGTGLGLSTVLGIVKQSGGSIQVYSEPGHGSSIKVYLPRIDQQVAQDVPASKTIARRGTETVLLVEDDEMVRSLVRESLERHGYKVLEAPEPAAARRILQGYDGPIHLLVTDLVMPGGNGRDLAEYVQGRRPEIKVLYMSGYTDSAVLDLGIGPGSEQAFIQKPFTPGALNEKVREVLEQGGVFRVEGAEKRRHAQ